MRHLTAQGLSERRALAVVGMSASSLRYQPALDRNVALRRRIVALAQMPRQCWRELVAERRPSARAAGVAPVRCAIYTRKSSDEGLEQAFNSLQAQRAACAAYIASQQSEGWIALETAYDDGGVSGATLARPALQRLLADIEAGRVDIIVVYKVDRLTRALSDFARLVEVFDRHAVSFVSVTQQFNTTTSMGRLTLHVLLSFAQFEREVTGERIRDKIAASKQQGLWMGGAPPLGYDVKNRRLIVNPAEAETVRTIFRLYRELRSVRLLRQRLQATGVTSKRRVLRDGRITGGRALNRGALYYLLRNRLYRGAMVHKGTAYPGAHAAIVDQDCGTTSRRSWPPTRTAHVEKDPASPVCSRASAGRPIFLTVPAVLHRSGTGMRLVVPGARPRTPDPRLIRLLWRAFAIHDRLMQSPVLTLPQIAAAEQVSASYVTGLLRLRYLAPDIVTAIVEGRQPAALTATTLMRDTRLPLAWTAQRARLGFASPPSQEGEPRGHPGDASQPGVVGVDARA